MRVRVAVGRGVGTGRAAVPASPRTHPPTSPTPPPHLADSPRAGVRKRAMQCLACLAPSLPPPSLHDLSSRLLARLGEGGTRGEAARTYVQAVGALR